MLDNLFKNIGGKIKTLAEITFALMAVGSVITAIVLFCVSMAFWWISLVVLAGGVVLSWVSTLFIYVVGEIADEVSATRYYVQELDRKADEARTKSAQAEEYEDRTSKRL